MYRKSKNAVKKFSDRPTPFLFSQVTGNINIFVRPNFDHWKNECKCSIHRTYSYQGNGATPITYLPCSCFVIVASAGAAAGGIIYLGTYVPYFFMGSSDRYASLTASTKIGSSILCNLAMAIGCQTIASFESTGEQLLANRLQLNA